MDSKTPTRYAFIDVQNTEGTVNQLLGFVIDWHKLYHYLKEQWNCEKIFFYSGIEKNDDVKALEYSALGKLGYEVHAKPYNIYKNPGKIIKISCPSRVSNVYRRRRF